jgi:predicted nuclease of predicted toxin-antitoxin system
MTVLVDVNLTPDWIPFLRSHGIAAVHWSDVGAPSAPDADLIAWATTNAHLLMTADVGLVSQIINSGRGQPSVLLLRTASQLVERIGLVVAHELKAHESELRLGAVLTLDDGRSRLRTLPLQR